MNLKPIFALMFLISCGESFHEQGTYALVKNSVNLMQKVGENRTYSNGILDERQTRDSYEDRLKWFASSSDIAWYLPKPKRRNSKCHRHLDAWKRAILDKEEWALRMVDSWGKSSDGMLYNNYEAPGSYDECLEVKTRYQEEYFEGKYCSVYYKPESSSGYPEEDHYVHEIRSRLGILSGYGSKSILPYRTYGTCIPNSCSQQELAESVATPLRTHELSLIRIDCYSASDKLQLTNADLLFLVYVMAIILLMVLATFMASSEDESSHLGSGVRDLIKTFHPKENLDKLFRVDHSPNENTITCLNGIRVISTIIVVLCHQCGMTVHSSNIMKLGENKIGLPFISLTVSSASLSVDSFLFISGLLLSWSCLKKFSSPERFRLTNFYSYRFFRLTPPIAVCCFFFATWARHLLSGPWSSEFQLITNACRKFWWKDVFYLFNFFPVSNSPDSFPACLGQCWYTAVDTQLFLFAPLLILPMIISTTKGIKLLAVSTVAAVIVPTIEILIRDLPPTNILGLSNEVEFYKHLYIMPWNRAGPWLVGIWTGLLLHRSSSEKNKQKENMKVILGWTTAIIMAMYIVMMMVDMNVNRDYYLGMSKLSRSIFGGLHRTVWASALGWVVYACHRGYGGAVNDFLSYPGFQPMARLTYSVFLLSLNIQFALAWSAKQQPYFSYFNKVLDTCGALFLSLVGAILLNLCVEIPTANILNLSLSKKRRKSKPSKIN